MSEPLTFKSLTEQMNNYLGNGGLFNPELMEHDKVSRLILDARDFLNDKELEEQALQARNERLEKAYEAYCKLLIEELKEVMPLAIAHGWKSSRFDQGEKLRAEIKAVLEEVNASAPR